MRIMSHSHARLTKHVQAHEAVITNEYWYGDGPPLLKMTFSAAKTAERQAEIVDLLEKAATKSKATGDRGQSRLLKKLAAEIDRCRPHDRCGSLACPLCARAFQRAKAAAEQQLFSSAFPKSPITAANVNDSGNVNLDPPRKILVMATVIPLHLQYRPQALVRLDIPKRNRWLKDVLTKAGLTSEIIAGSADISWERRDSKSYYQLHWHLTTWTGNSDRLQKQLLPFFPPKKKYDRPVVVTDLRNRGFLPYLNKAIRLPDLLRQNRRHLPELLLALDRTAPLDLMVIRGLRLSAQAGRLALRPFGPRET